MPLMSARDYHEFMLGSPSDLRTRDAFRRAVLHLVRNGTILDFGAGSGIDAKHYAENGCRVIAYDASTDMTRHAVEYCRANGSAPHVDILDMDYGSFLTNGTLQRPRANAITANFAVINLIQDPAPLFAAFERWLTPDGFILASLLSPYYVGDARYAWWWHRSVRFLRTGAFSVGGESGISFRYGLAAIARAARPHFTLKGVLPSSGETVPMPAIQRALSLRTNLYMFLLFRRA